MSSGRHDELRAHRSALELAVEQLTRDPDEAGASIRRISGHVVQLSEELGLEELSESALPLTHLDDELSETAVRSLLEALTDAIGSQATSGGDIVIIDDDRVSARLLQARLASTNHRVVLAESVAEAERALAASRVALIVLDLFLPDGDGRNLLVDLRNRSNTMDVPVIVLSGSGSAVAKSECIALGANAYVEKPFDPDAFIALVTAHLMRGPGESHVADPGEVDIVQPGAPNRVLLAEDDPVTAKLITHRLERDGFEVVHCLDGLSAFEHARAGGFGLLLLDVKMPGMDGFEVLGRLRDVEGDSSTPVVMLTAMGKESDVVKAFELGANDYVMKPFSPVELTARIRRLVPVG